MKRRHKADDELDEMMFEVVQSRGSCMDHVWVQEWLLRGGADVEEERSVKKYI